MLKKNQARVAAWKAFAERMNDVFPNGQEPTLGQIVSVLRQNTNLYALAVLAALGVASAPNEVAPPSLENVIGKLEVLEEVAWAGVLLAALTEKQTSSLTQGNSALPDSFSLAGGSPSESHANEGCPLYVTNTPSTQRPATGTGGVIRYSRKFLLSVQDHRVCTPPDKLPVVAAQNNVWRETFDPQRDANWMSPVPPRRVSNGYYSEEVQLREGTLSPRRCFNDRPVFEENAGSRNVPRPFPRRHADTSNSVDRRSLSPKRALQRSCEASAMDASEFKPCGKNQYILKTEARTVWGTENELEVDLSDLLLGAVEANEPINGKEMVRSPPLETAGPFFPRQSRMLSGGRRSPIGAPLGFGRGRTLASGGFTLSQEAAEHFPVIGQTEEQPAHGNTVLSVEKVAESDLGGSHLGRVSAGERPVLSVLEGVAHAATDVAGGEGGGFSESTQRTGILVDEPNSAEDTEVSATTVATSELESTGEQVELADLEVVATKGDRVDSDKIGVGRNEVEENGTAVHQSTVSSTATHLVSVTTAPIDRVGRFETEAETEVRDPAGLGSRSPKAETGVAAPADTSCAKPEAKIIVQTPLEPPTRFPAETEPVANASDQTDKTSSSVPTCLAEVTMGGSEMTLSGSEVLSEKTFDGNVDAKMSALERHENSTSEPMRDLNPPLDPEYVERFQATLPGARRQRRQATPKRIPYSDYASPSHASDLNRSLDPTFAPKCQTPTRVPVGQTFRSSSRSTSCARSTTSSSTSDLHDASEALEPPVLLAATGVGEVDLNPPMDLDVLAKFQSSLGRGSPRRKGFVPASSPTSFYPTLPLPTYRSGFSADLPPYGAPMAPSYVPPHGVPSAPDGYQHAPRQPRSCRPGVTRSPTRQVTGPAEPYEIQVVDVEYD